MKKGPVQNVDFRNPWSSLKFIFSRVAVAYILFYLITLAVIDYEKIQFGLGLRQLNFMMPKSYTYLLELESKHKAAEAEKIRKYIEFYLSVIEVLPKRADAYGMLGYCYYYIGDFEESAQYYQKAHDLRPEFFWFNYNLGAIYYNLKDYAKANDYFKQAISHNINFSYSYILNSNEIYMPILKSYHQPEQQAEVRIVNAFKFTQELVQVLSDHNQINAKRLPSQLVVRIF